MASKINTDNPKHHKYVDTNKYERKKNNKSINFNFISKIYDVTVLVKTLIVGINWFRTSRMVGISRYKIYRIYSDTYRTPNYHSSYHFNSNTNNISDRVGKGLIVWNDCNHKTFRVKKKNSFISKYYRGKPTIFKFK